MAKRTKSPYLCGHPTMDRSGDYVGPPCTHRVSPGQTHCAAGHQLAGLPEISFTRGSVLDQGTFDAEQILAEGLPHGVGDERIANLELRAGALGVDIRPTLSEDSDDEDVEWSTNEWCLSKTGPVEAADVLATRAGTDGGIEVLLIKRSHPPFASCWALPGGMRDAGESLQQTALREMTEETGLDGNDIVSSTWLGEEESFTWDVRFDGARVGAQKVVCAPGVQAIAGDDAVDAQWVSLEAVSRGDYPLAFGHAEWFRRASSENSEMAERFKVLVDATRARNERLLARINSIRAQKNAPQIGSSARSERTGIRPDG